MVSPTGCCTCTITKSRKQQKRKMSDSAGDHPRLVLHDFISPELCKELEFIHKSCSTVGYRPYVFSTTLSHLIATNSAHLILPFIPIRETLKDKVEEFFGCEYELFVEFTGLISWTKGANIGWHSDDNRSYLKQRDFAAVCYLNSYGKDFRGGLFHFQEGEPATFIPRAGDVLMYTADSRNIHSVDEITDGERLTLTLWFSRDKAFDEDAKLISLISQSPMGDLDKDSVSSLPFPAPSEMYWFSSERVPSHQSGFDVRWARVHILGYSFYFLEDEMCDCPLDSSEKDSELMLKPLWLARGDEIFNTEFANSLHALQVVQFYCWKISAVYAIDLGKDARNVKLYTKRSAMLKSAALGDHKLVGIVFGSVFPDESSQSSFNWAHFSAGVVAWEDYTRQLRRALFASLPHWRTDQALFTVPSD